MLCMEYEWDLIYWSTLCSLCVYNLLGPILYDAQEWYVMIAEWGNKRVGHFRTELTLVWYRRISVSFDISIIIMFQVNIQPDTCSFEDEVGVVAPDSDVVLAGHDSPEQQIQVLRVVFWVVLCSFADDSWRTVLIGYFITYYSVIK